MKKRGILLLTACLLIVALLAVGCLLFFSRQSVLLNWGFVCEVKGKPNADDISLRDPDAEAFFLDAYGMTLEQIELVEGKDSFFHAHREAEYAAIITALESAMYTPCETVFGECEYLYLQYRNCLGLARDEIAVVYTYADHKVYALYDGQCYVLDEYDVLKTELGKIVDVPEGIPIFSQRRKVRTDRFFVNGEQVDAIRSGFVHDAPQFPVEDMYHVLELVDQEMEGWISYDLPTEFDEFIRSENCISKSYPAYDKYTQTWVTEVEVYFPDEAGEYPELLYYPALKIAEARIRVYMDTQGQTKLITGDVDILRKIASMYEE